MMTLSLAPATPIEIRALGADHSRIERVEMRLAGVLMRVAPDLAVQQFANVTNLPPEIVRAQLVAKAQGESLQTVMAEPRSADKVSNRRIEAGGAVFVRVN